MRLAINESVMLLFRRFRSLLLLRYVCNLWWPEYSDIKDVML
jgi:hypothetical protein